MPVREKFRSGAAWFLKTMGFGMPVREKLGSGAAQFLEPGEHIQAVFSAHRWRPWYDQGGSDLYYAVVATDRRILLFKLDFFGRVAYVSGEVQRETQLGPCSATPHRIRAFSTELIVNRHFFKDVEEADRAAGFHCPRTLTGGRICKICTLSGICPERSRNPIRGPVILRRGLDPSGG